MTRTAVKTVTDFTFQSDFTAPATVVEEDTDTVSVTASELAELLANARQEGYLAAQTKFENEQGERLNSISEELKIALKDLLELADRLDEAELAPAAETNAKQLIAAACSHIVNGQRDLFVDQ